MQQKEMPMAFFLFGPDRFLCILQTPLTPESLATPQKKGSLSCMPFLCLTCLSLCLYLYLMSQLNCIFPCLLFDLAPAYPTHPSLISSHLFLQKVFHDCPTLAQAAHVCAPIAPPISLGALATLLFIPSFIHSLISSHQQANIEYSSNLGMCSGLIIQQEINQTKEVITRKHKCRGSSGAQSPRNKVSAPVPSCLVGWEKAGPCAVVSLPSHFPSTASGTFLFSPGTRG